MSEKTLERPTLVDLLKSRSVQHGDFVLSSGQRSEYYIDARLTTMSAAGLEVVGREGLDAIRQAGWEAEAVGGLTLGADPVSYAIARASLDTDTRLDAFTVRKEPKDHGRNRQIEGCFEAGIRVIVVEDVITSGGSALKAVEVVEREGGIVAGVLGVVDRQVSGRRAIEAAGYSVRTLVTVDNLGVPAPVAEP